MSEPQPKYHPAVEQIMDTAGDDIGRIKNQSVARDVADAEAELRTRGDETPGSIADMSDAETGLAVVDAALAEKPAEAMSVEARELDTIFGPDAATSDEAIKNARAASDSYDQLVEDSRDAHARAELARRTSLADARQNIDHQESQS